MEKATNSEMNARYNDEVLFLDGIVDAHPEILRLLSADEKAVLEVYYLTNNVQVPENIFSYREELLKSRPKIEIEAKEVLQKILRELGIEKFNYSTESDK